MDKQPLDFNENGNVNEVLHDPVMRIIDAVEDIGKLDYEPRVIGIFAAYIISALATIYGPYKLQELIGTLRESVENMGIKFSTLGIVKLAKEDSNTRALLYDRPAERMLSELIEFDKDDDDETEVTIARDDRVQN